jgi:hypothetical protein
MILIIKAIRFPLQHLINYLNTLQQTIKIIYNQNKSYLYFLSTSLSIRFFILTNNF